MSQYKEPSVLEYARFYGLATDHRATPSILQQLADAAATPHFDDYPGLFHIDETNGTPRRERFSIDDGAAVLLSSIKDVEYNRAGSSYDDFLPDVHRVRNMKMELPLLHTDPELDLQQFRCKVWPNFAKEYLPLEKVNEEQGEGLEWPSSYEKLPHQATVRSESEKLSVTRDDMRYLQNALKHNEEVDKYQIMEDDMKQYRRRKAIDPLTPPLLPLSPELLPFVPSSDVGHFELWSEATSPTREELRKFDDEIMRADAIVYKESDQDGIREDLEARFFDGDSLGDLFSPLRGARDLPSSPPCKRRRRRDLKVDSPLMPLRSEQSPPWKPKNMSFQEQLNSIIPDLPPVIEKPENVSSEDIDIFFTEMLQPIAKGVDRLIEQEQLQAADTIQRVKVPIMDFSRPAPSWEIHPVEKQDAAGSYRQQFTVSLMEEHFSNHLWPISRKAERAMQWAPFPAKLAKLPTEEIIEDESLSDYIAQPDMPDCNALTWKLDGLRILDDTESDIESINECCSPNTDAYESLMWRRKMDLKREYEEDVAGAREEDERANECRGKDSILGKKAHRMKPVGESFSAFNAIGDFMNIRNHQLETSNIDSPYFAPQIPQQEDKATNTKPTSTVISIPKPSSRVPSVPTPLPILTIPTMPRSFVISSTFLGNLKLCRRLREIYPSAELIERDFSLRSDLKPRSSKAVEGGTMDIDLAMSNEADIITSPGTGIILTTLQKIKQRSLPGQTARSSINDRISHSALRYENLFVLVSEGRIDNECESTDAGSAPGIDTEDCKAIIELTSFCSGIEGVHVVFVSGGEAELLTWMISLMIKHSVSSPNTQLLQDETSWEVFLRRVGLNAYAAQAVLAELKGPEGSLSKWSQSNEVSEDSGLAAFVKMSYRERVERFEHLFGGRRLLGIVGRTIDTRW